MFIFRSSSRKYDDSNDVYANGSLHLEGSVPYSFVSVTKKRNRNISVVGQYDKEENIFSIIIWEAAHILFIMLSS